MFTLILLFFITVLLYKYNLLLEELKELKELYSDLESIKVRHLVYSSEPTRPKPCREVSIQTEEYQPEVVAELEHFRQADDLEPSQVVSESIFHRSDETQGLLNGEWILEVRRGYAGGFFTVLFNKRFTYIVDKEGGLYLLMEKFSKRTTAYWFDTFANENRFKGNLRDLLLQNAALLRL